MFKKNLGKIVQRNDLTEPQMAQMITDIFSGNVTEAQIGAMMAALATKGETFEELA
ncbi:MAG: anthranilate phosphoribosyltransferase, partial [Deltaproteobacteria bacterium]|nr:anthranilate phosphoribosyltransferase [Deltaproteobacteria bacterium]